MHEREFIHGDIKPHNFSIGPPTKGKSIIYLYDFELSQRYIRKGQHRKEEAETEIIGCSPSFASASVSVSWALAS
jgi:serine/threonine protein kinase